MVTGDTVTSIALNPDWDFHRYNEKEFFGKDWLLSNSAIGFGVMADNNGIHWFVGFSSRRVDLVFWSETAEVADNVYIYLRSINIKQGIVGHSGEELRRYVDLQSSTFGKEVLTHRSKIYDNGGSQIYYRGEIEYHE